MFSLLNIFFFFPNYFSVFSSFLIVYFLDLEPIQKFQDTRKLFRINDFLALYFFILYEKDVGGINFT